MKRDILISLLVLFVLFFVPPQIGAIWRTHTILDIDGKVSRLYDLCDYAYREQIETFNEDNPILDVYLGEIVGMNVEAWEGFNVEKENPVYTFNRRDITPIKLASRYRPVVYHYEIYEMDKMYYLKVVYLVSHKKDNVKEYIVHYKYTNLTKEAVEEMNKRKDPYNP